MIKVTCSSTKGNNNRVIDTDSFLYSFNVEKGLQTTHSWIVSKQKFFEQLKLLLTQINPDKWLIQQLSYFLKKCLRLDAIRSHDNLTESILNNNTEFISMGLNLLAANEGWTKKIQQILIKFFGCGLNSGKSIHKPPALLTPP